MTQLTHLNENHEAHMVDVSGKTPTLRTARASGVIQMSPAALQALSQNAASKGNVLAVARIAAIQGTKQTSSLIPLCHQIALTHASVDFEVDTASSQVKATVTTSTENLTGVEMEALTGVSVALLTIYDMLKAVDKGMVISQIHLESKTGGKSGPYTASSSH